MAVEPSVLAEAELFKLCPEDTVAPIAQVANQVSYDTGEEIYYQGAPSDYVIAIRSGVCGIYVNQPDGTMMACAILGPNRLIGMTGFQFREPRPTTALAIMPTTVIQVPARTVQALLLENPSLRGVVYEELYHLAMRRWSDVMHTITSEEISFPVQEACPAMRNTRFLAMSNRTTGEIRGMCLRDFSCSEAEGMGCPMSGKPAQLFHPIFGALGNRVVE